MKIYDEKQSDLQTSDLSWLNYILLNSLSATSKVVSCRANNIMLNRPKRAGLRNFLARLDTLNAHEEIKVNYFRLKQNNMPLYRPI